MYDYFLNVKFAVINFIILTYVFYIKENIEDLLATVVPGYSVH